MQNVNGNIVDTIIRDKRISTKDAKPTVMNGQRVENELINGANEWKPHFYPQIDGDMKPARHQVIPLPPRDLARYHIAKPFWRKIDIADNDPLSSRRLQSFLHHLLSTKKEKSFGIEVARLIPRKQFARVTDRLINKKMCRFWGLLMLITSLLL